MTFLKEYENLGELGKVGDGAFAQVYKVRHIELGYVRAIRVLKDLITGEDSKQYKDFINECKCLLRLGNSGHPNIVRIYQPRLIENKAFWEMDYIEGYPVDSFIEKNNYFVPVKEINRFLLDISSALAYCHIDNYWFSLNRDEDRHLIEIDKTDGNKLIISDENRQKLIKKYCVVHNDIKSNNVMRKFDGSYILLDFGLSFGKDKTLSRSSLMNHGGIEYKAPEKWDKNAEQMTERTDIYSFGITLYEMLAGHVPFPYDNNLSQERANYEVSEHHKHTLPPPIEPLRKAAYETATGKTYKKDYPDWLEKVIMKCLEKDPQKRYANGKVLYEEVKQFVEKAKAANTVSREEFVKLKQQNNVLSDDLSKLAREKQQLKESKTVVVEKIVEKPVEKIIEKPVEKIVEKIVEKPVVVTQKVAKPLWVVLSGLFLLSTICFVYMYSQELQQRGDTPSPWDTTDISSLTSERDNLQQQLAEKQTEIEQLNSKIKKLDTKGQSANPSDLQKIIDAKNKEITQLKADKTSLEKDKTSLKNQLSKAQADLSKAQKNTGNTAESQRQINNLNTQISTLQSTIREKDKTIAEKQKVIDKLIGGT